MPCCRKAVSVWTACPDNQKPTGGSLAEGTCVAGVPLWGQGHNRCASLRPACGKGAILHAALGYERERSGATEWDNPDEG